MEVGDDHARADRTLPDADLQRRRPIRHQRLRPWLHAARPHRRRERGHPTASAYFDRSAFVCPGRVAGPDQFNCNIAPIGRFGNSGTGVLRGPGTVNLSMGIGKDFRIVERARLRLEGTFTNLPNHPNLADPGTNITALSFGTVTSVRGGDSGGNRVGQASLRLEF